jgi:probable HAF family extracellular repeat protein
MILKAPMSIRALAALGALSLAAPAHAVTYDCVRLRIEGNPPLADVSALNGKGQVAGTSVFEGSSHRQATLWSKHEVLDLASGFSDPVDSSNAYGLNDRGQVVGDVSFDCSGLCGAPRPVAWQDGVPSELPQLAGAISSAAISVNNKGRIVGESWNGEVTHAVLWRDGQVIDLGALGHKAKQAQTNSRAYFINDDHIAVGSSERRPHVEFERAVRWDAKGHITDLGALPGGWGSRALSINHAGTIVGNSYVEGGYHHRAVAWQDGQIVQLPTLTDGADSTALAINDSGTIVGGESLGEYYAALVWPSVDEPPQVLKTLVANACKSSDDAYTLDFAVGINAGGAIVANGYQNGVGWVGFLLTPR